MQSLIPKLCDKLFCQQFVWHCMGVLSDEQHGFTRCRSMICHFIVIFVLASKHKILVLATCFIVCSYTIFSNILSRAANIFFGQYRL